MNVLTKRTLSIVLSLSLAIPVSAAPADDSGPTSEDMQLAYWGQLDQENPLLADFALGEPVSEKPLWLVSGSNPLLDSDPFFMRSQTWTTQVEPCTESVCWNKDEKGALNLTFNEGDRALRIDGPISPVLETDDYLFLSADSQQIFRDKAGEDEPGEGLFFIAKRDLANALVHNIGVPIFFFPLPGAGWTGRNDHAFELSTSDQIVFYNQENFGLPIDRSDVALMEKVERNNLLLAQTWSFLEGNVKSGVPLPKPNTTLAFGLFLSGQLPQGSGQVASFERARALVAELSLVPKASAHEADATVHEALQAETTQRAEELKTENKPKKNWLRRWLAPVVMYGGTALAAVGMGGQIDWSHLITADMPQRILTVSEMLGSVLVASVAMKYSVHKALFDKKYPKTPDETFLQRLNKEHKGILDELTHGLWFSMAFLPQGIRHILDFLKDRFFPNNKMIRKAWEATMGYQMKQSSRLAMNWKTFYLGSLVFGMADSMMVGVHLLIFTPFLIHYFGWSLAAGAATAAFASAEVLRNFLGYLQGGAHSYSADVKMIHMKSAENEAKRQLQAEGVDPEAAKNEGQLQDLTLKEMEKRFKAVGLPGENEFIYDPLSVLESTAAKSGFSADTSNMTPEQKAVIENSDFVLRRRHWGLIKPALKKALNTARDAQTKAPSETGAKVVQLLEWATNSRGLSKSLGGRLWDVASSDWAQNDLKESIKSEVNSWLVSTNHPNWLGTLKAATKGALKYLAQDSTKEARDIRETLYLMSTSGSPNDMYQFLPKSWQEKAGSQDASILGAELFNRAFNSLLEHKPSLINADAKLEGAYGARANAVIERISRRNPALLADPFTRQVRYWELMNRLSQRDQDRLAVLNYQPKNSSAMEKQQWAIARAKAEERMAALPIEDQVAREWLGLAELYKNKSGDDVEAADWAQSYKYRLTVAQEFAAQVGLTVNDLDKSDFVGKVVVAASQATESELEVKKEKMYMRTLNDADRKFYEAQIFTRHFIGNYIDLSVRTDENLQASSPEYPGRLQKVRRALVGVPGGKYMSSVVRAVEAFFRNEDTSYAPGLWASLDRSLPILPDLYHNFIRNLRTMPYLMSLSYLTSYYVWQIHMPYPLWLLFIAVGFVNPALVEFNNRIMKNYGIKPMDDVPSKLTYSFLHSNLTNPEVMLIQAYAQPITEGFERAVGSCADILKGRKK